MPSSLDTQARRPMVRRNPIRAYFLLTFAISWIGALLIVAPSLLHGAEIPKFAGMLIFPAMLLGPAVGGLLMARAVDGPPGVRELFAAMNPGRISVKGYGPLLVLPVLKLIVLFSLQHSVSPVFAPNHFFMGVAFGVPAGLFEERRDRMDGVAFPKLRLKLNLAPAAIVLGILWGHGTSQRSTISALPCLMAYWFAFFLVFTFAMTAMRSSSLGLTKTPGAYCWHSLCTSVQRGRWSSSARLFLPHRKRCGMPSTDAFFG